MSARVLYVDDDESMRDVVATRLAARDYEIATASGGDEATAYLGTHDVDVVVTDLRMRGMSGTQLCTWVADNRPTTPVLVITAFGSLETAIAAMRAGAYDFLTKPVEIETLAIAIERAAQHRHLRDEVQRLRRVVERQSDASELMGESPVMREVHGLIERVATSTASVLITGESGTGKEVVARLLHRLGGRTGAFVAVNCAAVPEALLESELFGHVKGAFTDAKASRDGLLVQSTGGTILLDEIGDMPLALQPKLLRTLEDRKVRPVGGSREIPFDARIIAATHRDLEAAAQAGAFRSDLFFRLNVIQIELPPLRARGNDVLLLAQRFVDTFARQSGRAVAGLSSGAAEKLLGYGWPGNVRELRNCIERAVTLTQHSQLVVEDLPERVQASTRPAIIAPDNDPTELLPMAEVEKRYIRRVMELVGGNKALAARTLGFDRTTLYRKLQQYQLDAEA
jgi:two-component system response regulator AtoC